MGYEGLMKKRNKEEVSFRNYFDKNQPTYNVELFRVSPPPPTSSRTPLMLKTDETW